MAPTRPTSLRPPRWAPAWLVLALLAPALLSAPLRAQETFVVNSTLAEPDDDTGDDLCATAGGVCTLQAAVEQANSTAGLDNIHFDIPGTGPHVIQGTSLPQVTDAVVIDGYTQAGSSPNTNPLSQGSNAVLMIDLGSMNVLLQGSDTSDSIVRGLVTPHITVLFADGVAVEGNFVGTTTDGTGVGAPGGGSVVFALGTGGRVGGPDREDRNVIAAAGGTGGVALSNHDVLVQGNLIGTNAAGTSALGAANGVAVMADGAIVVGNVISGHAGVGIQIEASGGIFQSNFVGTDATGVAPLGNGGAGFVIDGGAQDATIGGVDLGQGNVIAHNGGDGVTILDPASAGHAILGNEIHDNAGLGIDLGGDGITANDAGDADAGPNGLRNFPLLDFAVAGSALVEGTIAAEASETYRVEFFANPTCDASGHGQGERFLGFEDVTTDGGGDGSFSAFFDEAATPGEAITATVTDAANNTSEFSACADAVGYTVGVSPVMPTINRGVGAATFDVTVTAEAGAFDREVDLSCADLPAGASCSFGPPQVTPGGGSASSTLFVFPSATTPTGASDFDVVGSYGAIDVAASTSVTVTDFIVDVTPTSASAPRGGDAVYTVDVQPDGPTFSEFVRLRCESLPAGASCDFDPVQLDPGETGDSSTLTVLTTNPDTPVGATMIDVVGEAVTVSLLHSASVELLVADFAIAVAPGEGRVRRGDSGTFEVTVSAGGGSFDDAVTLACTGLTAGASCSFDPPSVTPGGGSATSTLTLTSSDPDSPLGDDDFTVTATSATVVMTTDASVTVTDFTLMPVPQAATVTAALSATLEIIVSPEGAVFGDEVQLSCAELPAGVSCSFDPPAVTPDDDPVASALTLTATSLAQASRITDPPVERAGAPWGLWALLPLAALVGVGWSGRRRLPAALAILLLVLAGGISCSDPAGPGSLTASFTIEGTSGTLVNTATGTVTVE